MKHLNKSGGPVHFNGLSRRGFMTLVGGSATVIASGMRPVFAQEENNNAITTPAGGRMHVKPLPEPYFISHGTSVEMNWMQKQNDPRYLMDTGQFFVRNHTATPIIDATTWRLHVDGGGVEKALEISYEELLKMPSKTVTRFIECAGNCRSLFNEVLGTPGQGTQWGTGGYGVAEWSGVPLSDILEKAGLKNSAVSIMASGLDESNFEKPLPIGKALGEDTLLVTAMNGAPLPYDHGFPVRLLVPGWVGSYNVKWLGRLHVGEEQLYSKWNTSSYVMKGEGYADPEGPPEGEIIREQTIKSVLALPRPGTLPAGSQTIRGYAWSPYAPIEKVEVSMDEGKTFKPAKLIGPNIGAAGVRWEFAINAKPGKITILPRATDKKGHSQIPIAEQKHNVKGYVWKAVIPHQITFVG